MQDPKNLSVWQKSHLLTLDIYSVTRDYPKEELYGLVSQMRRASSSIPMNISEGCGRGGNPELAQFLYIAMGSTFELEYQLLLSRDLGYLTNQEYEKLCDNTIEVKQMLSALIKRVKSPGK